MRVKAKRQRVRKDGKGFRWSRSYWPGEITGIREDGVIVTFDEGESEPQYIPSGRFMRLPAPDDFVVGDRVENQVGTGTPETGTVTEIKWKKRQMTVLWDATDYVPLMYELTSFSRVKLVGRHVDPKKGPKGSSDDDAQWEPYKPNGSSQNYALNVGDVVMINGLTKNANLNGCSATITRAYPKGYIYDIYVNDNGPNWSGISGNFLTYIESPKTKTGGLEWSGSSSAFNQYKQSQDDFFEPPAKRPKSQSELC